MKTIVMTLTKFFARILPSTLKQQVYRITPLARFIRISLNRVVPEGVQEVEIAGGALKGYHLALDLRKEKDYWLGTYEPVLQQCIIDFVEPGWTVFDVGANIGYISLILQKAVGDRGRVIAFEALPENIGRFKRNIELNRKTESIFLLNKAVIDREGKVDFLVGPSGATGKAAGSAGRDITAKDTLTIEGVSLDDYIQAFPQNTPRLIKMDIEGGEILALKGMRTILATIRPLVFIEVHGRDAAEVVWQVFQDYAYRLNWMEKGYPPVESSKAIGKKAYLVAIPQ